MWKKVLITTPIYYVNWTPHIWHVYSSLIADTLARFNRSLWNDVKFSTWVDENSQKTVQKAQELWKDVYEYLDEMAQIHQSTWDKYKISYTDFIRTSSKKHKKVVQMILQKTYKNWYIYKSKYSGLYCNWCEAFKKNDELIEKDWELVCPDHLKPCEYINEENYFFKLTNFESFLNNFYKDNNGFIVPSWRFNEVKSFVNQWLEDFSISRENANFWIPFPFDKKHIVYVWYDALFNYYTVTLDDKLNQLWYFSDNIYHVIWKDISKFHAIYWPSMLEAVSLPKPKKIFVTGFFNVNWQKMSKSLWNVIDPIELVNKYWRDAITLYLFFDIRIWKDWDFSFERLEDLYKNILIWWRWNLVYRISKLSQKYKIDIWKFYHIENIENILEHKFIKSILNKNFENIMQDIVETADFQTYLKYWYELIQLTNKLIQDTQPWLIYKTNKEYATKILMTSIWLINKINLLWSFFFIDWFKKVTNIFDFNYIDNSKNFKWFFNELYKTELKILINPWILYEKL